MAGLARLAFDVFDYASALVEIRKNSRAPNFGELRRLRLNGLFGFVFEVRQVKVFEDELGDLVYVYFGLVVILARLIARARALPGPLSLTLASYYVADFGVAVSGGDVLFLAIVKTKLVLVKRADRHFDNPLAVGEDDRLVGDDRAEVLFYRLADSLLMAILIDLTFALK